MNTVVKCIHFLIELVSLITAKGHILKLSGGYKELDNLNASVYDKQEEIYSFRRVHNLNHTANYILKCTATGNSEYIITFKAC